MRNIMQRILAGIGDIVRGYSEVNEPLLKSEGEAAAATETETVTDEQINADAETVEDFEKSVAELDEELSKAAGGTPDLFPPSKTANVDGEDDDDGDDKGTEKKKSKKAMKKSDDGDEDDEGGDEDEEEDEEDDEKEEKKAPAKDKMKKSLEDIIRSNDEGAAQALDVEPFLKSLVSGIDERITAEFKSIRSELEAVKGVMLKSAAVSSSTGKMMKSVIETVEGIGNTVEDRKSLITSASPRERMFKSNGDGSKVIPYDEARSHLDTLSKSGKLSPTQVAVVEGRLNSGGELPDYFTKLIENVQ